MASAYRSVAALLFSMFILLVGSGLLTTIVPVGAKQHGFTDVEIGLMGSAYFGGMLIGAIVNPIAIRHSGHARAFTGSIAVAIMAVLFFPIIEHPVAWILSRGLLGFCFAGLYATVESWLQAKSDNAGRGKILGVYSVVQYVGWAIGNQLVRLDAPTSFTLFSLSAAILAAAILPLMVTTQDPPERPTYTRLPFRWLLKTSPVGVIGTFLIGWANGPFWSLSPVFALAVGLSAVGVATFMTMLTFGSAALQIPVGRLSDTMDRRLVLIALALGSILVEATLAHYGSRMGEWMLYAAAFALGSVVSTQYYVLAAHVNDRTGRENAVGVAAVLLFMYCLGSIIGPATASALIEPFGIGAIYWHNVVVHAALVAFLGWRMLRVGAPPVAATSPDVRAHG